VIVAAPERAWLIGRQRPAKKLGRERRGEGKNRLRRAKAEIAEIRTNREQDAERENLKNPRIGKRAFNRRFDRDRACRRGCCVRPVVVHRVLPLDSLNGASQFSCTKLNSAGERTSPNLSFLYIGSGEKLNEGNEQLDRCLSQIAQLDTQVFHIYRAQANLAG